MAIATELKVKWAGFKVLKSEVGFLPALRLGITAELSSDPFQSIGLAENEKEKKSRDQIRPAIQLYQTLLASFEKERAIEIIFKLVHEASVVFLKETIGQVDLSDYKTMNQAQRKAYLAEMTGRFFNAESEIAEMSDSHFIHRVTACRFPSLCESAGCPELAPAFCKGDLAFFKTQPVQLERPTTIAEGGETCEFRFFAKDSFIEETGEKQ